MREVVETFSDPRYRLGLADVQPDFLGRAYEYLLRKFAEGSGQSAGEFFTPTEVGFLMAHIMRPQARRGMPRLRLRVGGAARQASARRARARSNQQGAAQALWPGIDGRELRRRADERDHPRHERRDRARRHDDQSEIQDGGQQDPHATTSSSPTRCGTSRSIPTSSPTIRSTGSAPQGGITTGKGDWAWLQHTLACLNDRGRAAVVLDTGAVTRGSGSKNEDRERNIRKWFVDRDLIDGVILLPDNLFYNTNAAGVIVVLSKRKPAARKDHIVLLNATRRVAEGPAEELHPGRGHPPACRGFSERRADRRRGHCHHPAAG